MSADTVPPEAMEEARRVTDGLVPDPLLLVALLAATPSVIASAEKRGALDALHWLKLEHREWAYAIDRLMRRIESGEVVP